MRHRSLLHTLAFACLRRAILWQWMIFSLSGNEGPSNPKPRSSNDVTRESINPSRKVLIIDDDEGFREAVYFQVGSHGVQVEQVDSGEAAITKIQNGDSYDLILLDVMMPEKDGIVTYHDLRRINANALIVFMSAEPGTDECKEAERLEELLPKPIPDDDLIRLLLICGEDA